MGLQGAGVVDGDVGFSGESPDEAGCWVGEEEDGVVVVTVESDSCRRGRLCVWEVGDPRFCFVC